MEETPRKRSRATVIGIPLLALVGAIPLVLAAPFDVWIAYVREAKSWFDAIGALAPLAFVLFSAILTAIGFPRLVFCVLGGLLFGFAWGTVWSELGTVLGAYGTFLFARWSAREFVVKRYPKLRALAAQIQGKNGWWSVILIRQIPISGLYNDILLGISPISHRDFWIGTGLGFLPQGIAAALLGAGVVQTDIVKLGQYSAVAAVAFIVLTFSWNRVVAQARKQHAL